MKKNFVRIVAVLLIAMLALTLIPIGALAVNVEVGGVAYDEAKPGLGDEVGFFPGIAFLSGSSVTIKASDYKEDYNLIVGPDDQIYELEGLAKLHKSGQISFESSQKFSGNANIFVWLGYLPHVHKLSNWYSDGTTHWRECLECKEYPEFYEQFMYQNWCQDGDEDGICNVCGGDVPYHDVTVIETEGGKITVNKETASHRTKITADVEPADGYKLKKLHFTKIRDDGSEQEITRYKTNGQFWTYMPTYDLEVSAEFVKK